jgi:hypothetical protein
MAKQRIMTELGAAVDAIAKATQEISDIGAAASWRKAQVRKYADLSLAYEKALKDGKNHLATYQRGWSKMKGKLNPALASARKEFEFFVELASGAGREFKTLVTELEKVAT